MPSKVYLVTGANSGLGLATVQKLALLPETKTVYVACRSQAKANAAMEGLKVVSAELAFVKFDASDDSTAIAKNLNDIEPLDGLVLNAGGVGNDTTGKATGPNNVVPIHQINVIAHLQMVEILKKQGLLKKGCRIVFSGSEAARGIPMMGVASPKLGKDASWYVDELEGRRSHSFNPMAAYSLTKGLAALYFCAWARRNTEYTVLVVSPGATSGTEGFSAKAVPAHFKVIMPAMRPILQAMGSMHGLDKGSDRYVDALLGQGDMKDFASGTFVASARGTTGRVVDQSKLRSGKKYANQVMQEAAFTAMSKYVTNGTTVEGPIINDDDDDEQYA